MNAQVRRRAARVAMSAALCAVALLGAACAPDPGPLGPAESEQEAAAPDWFAGGTFPIEVSLPARTVSTTFALFGGPTTCTTTVVTPSVELPGATVTLAPVEIDPSGASVTIPSASVDLPRATISLGSLTLRCDGHHIGSIGMSVQFDGAASVGTARLDVATNTVTLTDPTLSITNASLRFTGAPAGLGPVPLDPYHLTVPSVDVPL